MQSLVSDKHAGKEGVCKNFVNGEWIDVDAHDTFEDTNPADTRQVLAVFPKSGSETAKSAIDAASLAQQKWAEISSPDRAKVLFKAVEILEEEKEDYARLLTVEEGKTLAESRGEINRTISVFRFFSGSGYRLYGQAIPSEDTKMNIYTTREPLGVVAVITPWNFPILLPSWKIAPALVCGNAVVFKPASYTPLIALKLVELLDRAGLPKGVLNFVTGSGSSLGEELIKNPKVSAVTFTGSNDVGTTIHESASRRSTMMRVQLEMGGKNPSVIMDDAELDKAVDIVSRAAFGVTGQSCSATERVIVHNDIYERFLTRLVERTSKIRIGNGLQGADMGPLVSLTERTKVLTYYELGKEEGAKVAYGASVIQGKEYEHGAFVLPAVFTDVSPDMRIAQEEIFGPVVAVFKFSTLDEALELANSVQYGLLACICTKNVDTIQYFAKKIKAGVVRVNRPTTGIEVQAPFGGIKKSGTNTYRENGDQAIEFYTQLKTVYMGT